MRILIILLLCVVCSGYNIPMYSLPEIAKYEDNICMNRNEIESRYYLDVEDTTIITNALHYYKKVKKEGNFKKYDIERINKLRDKIIRQQLNKEKNIFPPIFHF